MSDKDKGLSGFTEAVKGLASILEDNEDTINDFLGEDESDTYVVDGDSPMKEVFVDETEVKIVLEHRGEGGIADISITHKDDEMKIEIGDNSISAKVPSDVDIDGTEATYNNGVMQVTVPRNGGGE